MARSSARGFRFVIPCGHVISSKEKERLRGQEQKKKRMSHSSSTLLLGWGGGMRRLLEMAFIYSTPCFERKKADFLGILLCLQCMLKPRVASRRIAREKGMKN